VKQAKFERELHMLHESNRTEVDNVAKKVIHVDSPQRSGQAGPDYF
jgi:hypothetical protein